MTRGAVVLALVCITWSAHSASACFPSPQCRCAPLEDAEALVWAWPRDPQTLLPSNPRFLVRRHDAHGQPINWNIPEAVNGAQALEILLEPAGVGGEWAWLQPTAPLLPSTYTLHGYSHTEQRTLFERSFMVGIWPRPALPVGVEGLVIEPLGRSLAYDYACYGESVASAQLRITHDVSDSEPPAIAVWRWNDPETGALRESLLPGERDETDWRIVLLGTSAGHDPYDLCFGEPWVAYPGFHVEGELLLFDAAGRLLHAESHVVELELNDLYRPHTCPGPDDWEPSCTGGGPGCLEDLPRVDSLPPELQEGLQPRQADADAGSSRAAPGAGDGDIQETGADAEGGRDAATSYTGGCRVGSGSHGVAGADEGSELQQGDAVHRFAAWLLLVMVAQRLRRRDRARSTHPRQAQRR